MGKDGYSIRRLTCRVVSLDSMTGDIRRVRLSIETGGPFEFLAGQYARVKFSGQPTRDYSMASRSEDAFIEFHIRRITGGSSSNYAADELQDGEIVHVEGPFGTCYLREAHRGPILAIAGGSGLAPIKSIVETALARGMRQDTALYFGVRDEGDLYLVEHFNALAECHPNLRFIPVLSEPLRPTKRRSGLVHDAVAADWHGFDGCKAYLAGPPIMVNAATEMLRARGMHDEDIHADAFYTEAEKPRSHP
jgi:CDP-4-dehydro-6-deoxyglucose reductase/ferredoxin-NAD(P)+ reductase (naphthalene dioxygenase ferredoxin-specific)